MQKVKRISIMILCFMVFFLTGCSNNSSKENNNASKELGEIIGQIYEAETYNGDIVIDKSNITSDVSYYNYKYEGIYIGLLAVKDENGHIHIVINTCQSCGGSPNAYFVQVGNKIECENCGNTFLITELNDLVPYGCNPIAIENIQEKDGKFIIAHEEIEQYKVKFENWEGPKK